MKRVIGVAVLLATVVGVLHAHDLFFRPVQFFVAPGATLSIPVLNGTFERSENAVTPDRLTDLSAVEGGKRRAVPHGDWKPKGDTTYLQLSAGANGTLLIGAAIAPRLLRMEAKAFNEYLRDDAVPDILAARRAEGRLGEPSRELYAKHIKTLVQVGPTPGAGYDQVLGYAAELVPLENPYALARGATLHLKALVDGAPMPGQTVMFGGRSPTGSRFKARRVVTDAQGIAAVPLNSAGAWYVQFIRMVPAAAGDSVNYVSKWATLTFGVR